ncbi:MAG: redoxin family protein [bacterium]
MPRRASARDLRGNQRALRELTGEKATVLAFLGIDCPLANLYAPRLVSLEAKYRAQGVRFLAVYSNRTETLHEVAAHALDNEFPFVVLRDFGQRLADQLGVDRTPEVVVFGDKGKLRYRGRIDDQYSAASRKASAENEDLVNALDALVAGKRVTVEETVCDGCLMQRTGFDSGVSGVTFTRDVEPILQERCQACHRPGQIGPFSLMSYKDAASRSRMIAEVVEQRRMPPWHADQRYGSFANDRSLSEEQIATITTWVSEGSKKGQSADSPPEVEWTEGFTMKNPDSILSIPKAMEVPAEGVLEYQYVTTETDYGEDVWVQRVELSPGNASVLHHALVYIIPKGRSASMFNRLSSALVNWVPGSMAKVNPEGSATKIPEGASLLWELHYTPNGKATTDRTSMALDFTEEPPDRETRFTIFADFRINVSAENPHHIEEHTMRFRNDARLVSLRPHMHLRGKSWTYEVTFPDGRNEILLSVPNWDFNWQTEYFFTEPIDVPKGTVLSSRAIWDNSEDNPLNPDPTVSVRYGRQSFEEMMNGWVKYDRVRE